VFAPYLAKDKVGLPFPFLARADGRLRAAWTERRYARVDQITRDQCHNTNSARLDQSLRPKRYRKPTRLR